MANPFNALVGGVLGNPGQALGDAVTHAFDATKSFGGVGDVGSLVGGLTGTDPFTGLSQSRWERLIAMGALAGLGGA